MAARFSFQEVLDFKNGFRFIILHLYLGEKSRKSTVR